MDRIGLVVHPSRELTGALATVHAWAAEQDAEVVQVRTPGSRREVAPYGPVETCDLVIAMGGDGTALAAIRAAAPARRPVMGVACGSLGALTAVTADDLGAALERVAEGAWSARHLPGLIVEQDAGDPIPPSVNDLVMIRRGAGQVIASVRIDGRLFIRFAGDGLVVATPLGSSAYTLAAGGPVIGPGGAGIVITPLAPHGGCCPPLVASPHSRLEIDLEPGHGGARLEGDGQAAGEVERMATRRLTVTSEPEHGILVVLGEGEHMLEGLRRRRVIIDSPRLIARDERDSRPYPG